MAKLDLKALETGMDTIDSEDLIALAEEKAQAFKADKLKTSQLRNFYSAVLQVRQEYERQQGAFTNKIKTMLVLLKPKLAFAAGRQHAVRKSFKPFMDAAINGVLNAPDADPKENKKSGKQRALENYLALIESVVAYHKFYE